MSYIQIVYDRILIAVHGYKTPQKLIDKLNNPEQRQYRAQNYTSNRKSIYINPPFDGKKL